MRNISSSNKKFLDAIRFKNTQELREFKKQNDKTVKQLATSSRKKKVEDLSLAGATRVIKESSQNDRILSDMIKEATTFDNRLKKVGLAIDIKKLINDKEGYKKSAAELYEDEDDIEGRIADDQY